LREVKLRKREVLLEVCLHVEKIVKARLKGGEWKGESKKRLVSSVERGRTF
jgi:hypothetical protein